MTTETLSSGSKIPEPEQGSEQALSSIEELFSRQQLFVTSELTQWTRATEDKPSAY
uniref:hypothetical protein n=1 Tax=Streptomyces mesophilus TaxID=1775132 RepID=UPI0019D24937|nr:hypothetical protein [Streptomyces mesophilus]